MTTYYKAVDSEGLTYFPITKSKRIDWVALIGQTYALGDEDAWLEAVEKLREGQTTVCTKHLIHGYADIALAIDFGERHAEERAGKNNPNLGFRIVEFSGEPVAQLEGTMLLDIKPWEDAEIERFADAVKYGFRSVNILREVPKEDWPF